MNNEFTDHLTKVLNRAGLFHSYDNLIKDTSFQLLFFDIDNFKTINDIYGHKSGDEALIRFSNILTTNAPQNSYVVRLGGDEFIMLIAENKSRESIEELASNILSDTRKLKEENRIFEVMSCSIGILTNISNNTSLENALNLADKAMYYSKEAGKDTFVFYSDFEDKIKRETEIEKNAVKALDEGQFTICYHPSINLHSSKLIRTEACCIWTLPDGAVLGRNDFRPILEMNGFIKEVDLYIFEKACEDLVKFKDKSGKQGIIGVQLSYLHILDEHLPERLFKIMEKYGVSASDFDINVDENAFGKRTAIEKIVKNLNTLSEKGFNISLSKFGEDFSSVRYLSMLPLFALKFDGEFISENLNKEIAERVLKSTTELGKGYKFRTIACDVNDNEAMLNLAKCGFDAASGDYFCKKLCFDDYLNYLIENMSDDESTVSYRFKNNLKDEKGFNEAVIVGHNIEYVEGITNKYGALKFPGGPVKTNLIQLPPSLFENGSYTVSMWIKPLELQNWVSAFYIRYIDGFSSFMPNISGGRSMFRTCEDAILDKWNDAMSGAVGTNKWVYISFSFDSYTQIGRLFVNGELGASITDVPALKSPSDVWLGGDSFQISYCGLISALQIDNSPLTPETIMERYKAFITDGADISSDDPEEYSTEVYVHDPAIYEDPSSHEFFIYGTEAISYTSDDLIHWHALGKVVEAPPASAKEHTKSASIWAPDIVKVGDEYRLYCSNSSWGVCNSCIFLATSKTPNGPFIPKGIVHKTDNTSDTNSIDANIIEEHETGRQFMVYGSFWSGVHIIELNRETGYAIEGQGNGKQIASRPLWNDGAIEGPYIIYHPDTEYYYLFVSFGSLKSDYNIRVGRSKSVTGPYLDYEGKDLNDVTDENCTRGLMISCGYRWLSGTAYMGPGHNSVLLRDNGDMFLVSHIRKLSFNADPGPGLLQIRKLIMTPDGWPIALSQPYNAETLLKVRDDLIYGDYERIELRPSIPQGISHAHPMTLFENGRLEIASVIGSWERTGDHTMVFKYGPITEYVHFEKGYDKEKNQTTIIMGGLTSQGITTWAKKEELAYE